MVISKFNRSPSPPWTLLFSYMLLADYDSYIKCQDRVSELFKVSSVDDLFFDKPDSLVIVS